jgi:hypothetical protein
MKYLPFDSVLDMVIVLGAHILLWDSVMMLYLFGRETPKFAYMWLWLSQDCCL